MENGKNISSGIMPEAGMRGRKVKENFLRICLGKMKRLPLGKKYKEKLTVKNSGAIDEYVRVSIVKSWTDKDGNKGNIPVAEIN